MLKTNEKKLIQMSVQGKVANPMKRSAGHVVDHNGEPFSLPGTGGIVYNVKVGDSVYGWEGDHIEPAVSSAADEKERNGAKNTGYNFYSCIGNEAVIISSSDSSIKGKTGVVTGHHGGIEHVIIDFPDKVLQKMTLKDEILVKGFGQGLKFIDYPKVKIFNIDPELLKKLNIREKKLKTKRKIQMGVSAIVPGELMGSGVGSLSTGSGDYDMMTMDEKYLKKHNLLDMKFGDIVAIANHDNRFGKCFRKGAVTIGVVIHSDCKVSGHGPGIATILSDDGSGIIEPFIDKKANIGQILKIGRYSNKK
ncbi:MAG: DUF4438 domain-containing protein [Candidatus Muiribacteriota bacterium]